MWFAAHPNEMPPIATVQQLPNPNTWSYEPDQNISNDVNVGLAAIPMPGRIDAASSMNNNNNQIIPNYYDSNASISTPDLVPPPHLQPPTPYQSQPYQLPKVSQPNQPSFQFPYYDDNNNSASNVQPNYYPLPESPTQDPQDLNSKIFVSSQFQFSAQYQLPSATQPSKFINIANGVNNNDQQNHQQQSQSTTAATTTGTNLNTNNNKNNDNNNNNIRGGRCDFVGNSNGRPVSGRGSECWYYKFGKCILD